MKLGPNWVQWAKKTEEMNDIFKCYVYFECDGKWIDDKTNDKPSWNDIVSQILVKAKLNCE